MFYEFVVFRIDPVMFCLFVWPTLQHREWEILFFSISSESRNCQGGRRSVLFTTHCHSFLWTEYLCGSLNMSQCHLYLFVSFRPRNPGHIATQTLRIPWIAIWKLFIYCCTSSGSVDPNISMLFKSPPVVCIWVPVSVIAEENSWIAFTKVFLPF